LSLSLRPNGYTFNPNSRYLAYMHKRIDTLITVLQNTCSITRKHLQGMLYDLKSWEKYGKQISAIQHRLGAWVKANDDMRSGLMVVGKGKSKMLDMTGSYEQLEQLYQECSALHAAMARSQGVIEQDNKWMFDEKVKRHSDNNLLAIEEFKRNRIQLWRVEMKTLLAEAGVPITSLALNTACI
jgi:hypothetical protein